MKIGILTFHWATNYGAVLQSYALQNVIENYKNQVEIIDYYPLRYKKRIINALKTKHLLSIPFRIKEIGKEKKIEIFRLKYLKRTKKYFSSNEMLHKEYFNFDCYICGSDQIWNQSFIEHGEKQKVFSYFLDFAPENKIIASYAASFGTLNFKEGMKNDLVKYLKRLDFISVRESSGAKIIEDLGMDLYGVVPDPTLLLKKAEYMQFILKPSIKNYAYVYMLHSKEKDANKVVTTLKKTEKNILRAGTESIEQWLTNIYYSDIVVTNSFHGIVFSIIFERPFVAILIKGSGMNDRIISLLNRLGLEERIYVGNDSIVKKTIDWGSVKKKLEAFQQVGFDYIEKILNYRKEL